MSPWDLFVATSGIDLSMPDPHDDVLCRTELHGMCWCSCPECWSTDDDACICIRCCYDDGSGHDLLQR